MAFFRTASSFSLRPAERRICNESTEIANVRGYHKEQNHGLIESTHLFHKSPKFAELFQNGLVGDGLDILDVIKGLALLMPRKTTPRLPRIDSFQNTKTSEVLDGYLEHFQAFRSSNESSFQSRVVLLLLLSHARKLSL